MNSGEKELLLEGKKCENEYEYERAISYYNRAGKINCKESMSSKM